MTYNKAVCVDKCDGRGAQKKSPYHVHDKTESARKLLCSLTFKQDLTDLLEVICNLKVSIRSDLDKRIPSSSDPTTVRQAYPSEATCTLLKELKTRINESPFIQYIPDIFGCPVWYFIFLNPHTKPIKDDLPCDDLIRRKIVAVTEDEQEVSLFRLCKGADGNEYIPYPVSHHAGGPPSGEHVVTYQQALGELERLLRLALEANHLVCLA